MTEIARLHLGCGNDPKPEWINHDLMPLPGVDVVHDLNIRPWPWADNEFDEVWAKDVLEHLPDTVRTIEELYRITKPGASAYIAVPYWNSWEAITDPTHVPVPRESVSPHRERPPGYGNTVQRTS